MEFPEKVSEGALEKPVKLTFKNQVLFHVVRTISSLKDTQIMANKITDMIKIRKVFRCFSNGKTELFISKYFSLSKNAVKKAYLLF